ncbi:unnamed protein product [Brassica rapa]|uniref:Uncharacterized protein n=1 Tax=Brassica campestris TaxID=3711 RepID=A0A3P5YLG8_BRACM|nr:unnamed protein product [Brassica rapa]VDC61641.1 unnamed protein product [Brassica rapa]
MRCAHHLFDEIHETSFLGSQLCDRIHMIKRSLENLTAKARSSGANGQRFQALFFFTSCSCLLKKSGSIQLPMISDQFAIQKVVSCWT